MVRILSILALACLAMIAESEQTAFSQGRSGKIKGTVLDGRTMRPVSFATVVIEGTELGALCDMNGEYVIIRVSRGIYRISLAEYRFERNLVTYRYRSQSIDSVRIDRNRTVTLDFWVEAEPVDSTITTSYWDAWGPEPVPSLARKTPTRPVWSREEFGRIVGRVLNEKTLEPIPGAAIIVPSLLHTAYCDTSGRFSLNRIAVGFHYICSSAPGHSQLCLDSIGVFAGRDVFVEFTLAPESSSPFESRQGFFEAILKDSTKIPKFRSITYAPHDSSPEDNSHKSGRCLHGQVFDSSGVRPIPFVEVLLNGEDIGTQSDSNGYFAICNVPPGYHRVCASAIGYFAACSDSITIPADSAKVVNFRLRQAMIETIE